MDDRSREAGSIDGIWQALNVLVRPHHAWRAILTARISTAQLTLGYALPFALVPTATSIISALHLASEASVQPSPQAWLTFAGVTATMCVTRLGVAALLAHMIFKLATIHGWSDDRNRALRLAVYSSMPMWIGSGLYLLSNSDLVTIGLLGYSLYLLHVGMRAAYVTDEAEFEEAFKGTVWVALGLRVGALLVWLFLARFLERGAPDLAAAALPY